jgi:hypothetical protein
MTTKKDSAGHIYADVRNIRVTYVPKAARAAAKDWAGQDVLRIQSYREDSSAGNKSLHMGAEIPIESAEVFGEFVAAICQVYAEGA